MSIVGETALKRLSQSAHPVRQRGRARIVTGWRLLYPPPGGGNFLLQPHGDGPEPLGKRFRGRVHDERPRTRLAAGEVLQLVGRAVQRAKLDVKMIVVVGAAVGGPLVLYHHVRQGKAPQRVVPRQHRFQRARQRPALPRQIGQRGAMGPREDVHFIRIAGEKRDEGDEMPVFVDDAAAVLLLFLNDVAPQAATVALEMFPARGQLPGGNGRDERKRVAF